jgi:anti-sigma-K factor RskA
MNYDKPELIERLAAEYVLGTLRGRARDRFASVLRAVPAARAAVWRWEARLHGFDDMPIDAAPRLTMPPEHVWQRITSHLHLNQAEVIPLTSAQRRVDSRSRLWKGVAAFATAASFVLAILLVRVAEVPFTAADHVAVFSDQQSQPQWLVSVDIESGKFTARALNAPALEAGKAFELWMLPGEGAAPRSLGLLPASSHALHAQLPQATLSVLRATSALAVSLEPAGGSPTGLPTGPVLYQARLLKL